MSAEHKTTWVINCRRIYL